MDFPDGCGFIMIDQENKKDVKSALRSVQRYLYGLGYKRGKKKGMTHENDMKSVLWGRVKSFIQEHVKPIIVSVAEEAGLTVVWSPPHHSDLQPIELVWANIKGTVGRQYTTEMTFKDVKTRLIAAFIQLQSKTVSGCIRKADNHLQNLLEHILAMENIVEDSDDDNDDDSDEDGSAMPEEIFFWIKGMR